MNAVATALGNPRRDLANETSFPAFLPLLRRDGFNSERIAAHQGSQFEECHPQFLVALIQDPHEAEYHGSGGTCQKLLISWMTEIRERIQEPARAR